MNTITITHSRKKISNIFNANPQFHLTARSFNSAVKTASSEMENGVIQ